MPKKQSTGDKHAQTYQRRFKAGKIPGLRLSPPEAHQTAPAGASAAKPPNLARSKPPKPGTRKKSLENLVSEPLTQSGPRETFSGRRISPQKIPAAASSPEPKPKDYLDLAIPDATPLQVCFWADRYSVVVRHTNGSSMAERDYVQLNHCRSLMAATCIPSAHNMYLSGPFPFYSHLRPLACPA